MRTWPAVVEKSDDNANRFSKYRAFLYTIIQTLGKSKKDVFIG